MPATLRLSGVCKTPMLSRISFGCGLVGCLLGTTTAGAEELAEADIIRLVQEANPSVVAARAAAGVADAERLEAVLYPNPSIVWDREHFPDDGPADESEDSVFLSVPVDLSTRRVTRESLALAEAAVADAQALRTQTDVVVQALSLLYRILAEQGRGEIEQRTVDRLAEAARVVRRRREVGTVSGYDEARIEIESELAASRLRQVRARVERLRVELALLLGVDADETTFAGSLDPDYEFETRSEESEMTERPSLRLLESADEHARDAQEAAKWTWIPAFSIAGGLRIGLTDETRYGYVAGVALELPVASRGQELRAKADAGRRYARARVEAEQNAVAIERMRAERLLSVTLEEARRFDTATRDRAERLERAAESGYREGQRTIVELLDARRSRSEVETRRLELAVSVKQAEVALRAARGAFE